VQDHPLNGLVRGRELAGVGGFAGEHFLLLGLAQDDFFQGVAFDGGTSTS
jgi:hypothetical protein